MESVLECRGLRYKTQYSALALHLLFEAASDAWHRGKGKGRGMEALEGWQMTDDTSAEQTALTVCLQLARLAAAAARLVDGLDNEDVLSAALQTMDRVVVLLDVGHNHPAVR